MASESTQQHRQEAKKYPGGNLAVLTISDTRTLETDKSGKIICELMQEAGHQIWIHEVLPDEPDQIRSKVLELCDNDDIDAVLTNGGTGIAKRDGTYEAISGILEKTLPGFGELFRMLSWDEVQAASMLSRAVGGLKGDTLIFCMPGSSNAVKLACNKLLAPELGHLLWEMKEH